ncbi:large ribosomal subunit protein mL46 isoform X1 [Lethenteron reissneri]|uniref:large ribosomal subunit protein mL46 isoform X1 n=1 Tax=Lethenteron reissneri TaxID=7753 RepID=UPI002AB7AEFD|nr:large ribosomal subunit protein mL46 isoform X1 [Lethenteron reissneri]
MAAPLTTLARRLSSSAAGYASLWPRAQRPSLALASSRLLLPPLSRPYAAGAAVHGGARLPGPASPSGSAGKSGISRRGGARPQSPETSGTPQWKLFAAACVERYPRLSQELSAEEKLFGELVQQIELERSALSDHEIQLVEDAARIQMRQANEELDSDDEDDRPGIVTAEDKEDMYEQRLKQFQPGSRVTDADTRDDRTSLERRLDDKLVLIVQQRLGQEDVWLLPQVAWNEGETLRDTAERALGDAAGSGLQAKFMGNAPFGFYRYKFPVAMRQPSAIGAKVFFFKAVLLGGDVTGTVADAGATAGPRHVWVTRRELKDYLKPAYLKAVESFIMDVETHGPAE